MTEILKLTTRVEAFVKLGGRRFDSARLHWYTKEAMNLLTILKAIGHTEASSFREFCNELGDACPERGDTSEWGALFRMLRSAESDGLITVNRFGSNIDNLQLTEAGAAHVRANPDRGW